MSIDHDPLLDLQLFKIIVDALIALVVHNFLNSLA